MRDRRAWECVRTWPDAAGFDPRLPDGLDGALLTRWFLWDKVGRAIRRELDPDEMTWPATPPPAQAAAQAAPRRPQQRLRRAALWTRLRAQRVLRQRKVLYCPFPYSRHARILETLLQPDLPLAVVVPETHAADWPGAVPWRASQPAPAPPARDALIAAMVRGLALQQVRLTEAEVALLRSQVQAQACSLHNMQAALAQLRPDAVLVPGDNHPPFIECVLAARGLGIPVLMLQHGLDCERYYLDDAYATHIAVWGPARAERYRRESAWQPEHVTVVGNPAYDDWPENVPEAPPHWLWVTRPHRPEKCYAPSRRPDEGVRILDALLGALAEIPAAQLTIKAHPFDNAQAYARRIPTALAPRVRLTDDTVLNLLRHCRTVITEDSTAGMDAMLAGRALLHAHFAATPPVVPFVAFGAALPGFDPAALREALRQATGTPDAVAAAQRVGQQRFLDAHAGPRDRGASRRFATFVMDALCASRV